MADATIRYWHELTAAESDRLAKQDPVAVLLLAAVEQHGPHLALSTDLDIGLGLLSVAFARLPATFPAVALPPQAIGASREHTRFPGTLSIPPSVLGELIRHQGAGVARCGVRRLVVVNSHGGNRAALDAAALRLRDEAGLLVVKVNYPDLPRPGMVDLPEAEWRHGLHGGAVETAMMRYLHPDRVREAEASRATSFAAELDRQGSRIAPEGASAFAWLAEDLHPSGAVGDATLGTADFGRRLVDYYGATLAAVIRDARSFPIDRLG
jgi:creatinine amidohydrolase